MKYNDEGLQGILFARSKIDNAIRAAQVTADQWSSREDTGIEIRPEVDTASAKFLCRVFINRPSSFSRLTSQLASAIKLGRESLDNLITSLAYLNGVNAENDRSLSFPIVEDAGKWKKRIKPLTTKLHPDHIRRLADVQPFRQNFIPPDTWHPLNYLNILANADKHRTGFKLKATFAPAPGISQVGSISAKIDGDTIPNEDWLKPQLEDFHINPGPFDHGDVFLSFSIPQSTPLETLQIGGFQPNLTLTALVANDSTNFSAVDMTVKSLDFAKDAIEYIYGTQTVAPKPWWPYADLRQLDETVLGSIHMHTSNRSRNIVWNGSPSSLKRRV